MKQIFKLFVSTSTILIMVLSPFTSLSPAVFAADTGFNPPSANANYGWTNPGNAYVSDDSRAVADNKNNFVHYYNFGLSIPSGSAINGIEVQVEGYTTNSRQAVIDLSWNGGSSYTSGSGDKTTNMPGTTAAAEAVRTFGGPTDTWNRTWASGDFTNFRVRLNANSSNGALYIDYIQVKVYYTEPVQPATNPTLSQSCGLDIALVLDSSGSISTPELNQMKDAFETFVDTFLPETPTQFSVTDFDDTATMLQGFTSDTSLINTAINTPTSGGYTNWEQGLLEAQGTFDPRLNPNLVIFASDGNPNRIGNPTQQVSETEAVNAAMVVANALKNSGTRIIALGIGDDLSVANLEKISSADAVYTSDFSTLAADLTVLASELCGGTITARKIIDEDGNLQTAGDQTPGVDWSFDVAGSQEVTDQSGYTSAVEVDQGTYSVSETLETGYSLIDASCTGTTNNGTLSGTTISGIEVGNQDIISCVFYNSPQCIPSEEVCDGVDNDCDGYIDEDISSVPTNCGVGACASTGELICSQGSLIDTCQPGIPSPEECDNIDNNCDGTVDENLTQPTGNQNGLCSGNTETCSAGEWIADGGNYEPTDEVCDAGQLDEDCDGSSNEGCECIDGDTQPCGPQTDEGECIFGTQTCVGGVWGECVDAVYPAEEICDGLDNDCDGETDEGVLLTFYEDADSDTYGNGQMPTQACSAPEGYVSDDTDCDDTNSEINPGATEICGNQIDEDCSGADLECPFLTINAYKIVCQTETDLPNRGDGGPHITSTTAQDFVNGNQNCQRETGWEFEWAYTGTSNPGDNIIGPAGTGWTTFGPTNSNGEAVTTVNSLSGDRIWVREVMQEGYVPFSGDMTAPYDDVSAELYCHQDVLNYDNYDYIINPQLENTYYCVGFNAPVFQTECTPQDTQPCETGNLGICAAGTQTCNELGFWGECVQTNEPAQEICDNQLDDDCDGYTDSEDTDCQQCTPQDTQPCETDQSGICSTGIQTSNEFGFWQE